ncbi:hypothetical protein [Tessaracoccus coleopterorum]|uniref:hypothetical protein n=1 Tax=Tessaracoccus coleopterorum TaxID=2714950 RepID=UPI001E4C0A35|nr:hypothetical protein [Tessaracoccus coleopterorum]
MVEARGTGAAALLPAFAVLFANNQDHRAPSTVPGDQPASSLAITSGEVVQGTVEEESDK